MGPPVNGLYGKGPPERRQVYQTVGNTRDDIFGMVGKSIVKVFKRAWLYHFDLFNVTRK